MVVQNNRPPSASTKCHLQWLKAKPPHTAQRKLKFLDILDDLTYRDLLPIQSEYPRKDNQQARELDYKDVQDTYLYKMLYGKQSNKSVWQHLLKPTVKTSKVCNLCKTPRSPNSKKAKEKSNESFLDKFCAQNYSKSDILKKLSSYIFDPQRTNENCSQSVIVMPVRVYYDNFKPNEQPTKLSSTNKPFLNALKKSSMLQSKDVKSKHMEWFKPKISKPMKVVYDSLPNKPEIPSITTSIKPRAMPSKPVVNSARLNVEKKPIKKASSKSFSPKSFASYCQVSKNGKNNPTNAGQQENLTLYNKIQADIEKIKREIYGKKVSQTDRKIWEHKYGKSVGQKLISFVEHQQAVPEPPVPLYALPKLEIQAYPPNAKNAFGPSREINPQKQVLRQVQGLKTKNEAIQNNIKKAIDVIETRMVDILCDDSKSVEAFNVMEKEITNVLSLMKCNGRTNLKPISPKSCDSKDEIAPNTVKSANKSLEDNYNIISEHLFERLERILDTGGSSMSNTSINISSEIKQLKKEREEARKKQKLPSSRRTKIGIVSNSSSASMDEKITSKRSTRVYSKKIGRIEGKSKLSATTIALISEPITTENWGNVCGDQNMIRSTSALNDSQSDTKTEEDKTEICEDQIWHKHGGDFVKQDDVVLKSEMSVEEASNADINKVISDDRVEKLITDEKSDILNSPESVDAFKSIPTSDVEEFINNELNKVIDSIVSLGEETILDQTLNELAVKTEHIKKDIVESSDYNTPPSEALDVDKKLEMMNRGDTSLYSDTPQCEVQDIDKQKKIMMKDDDSDASMLTDVDKKTQIMNKGDTSNYTDTPRCQLLEFDKEKQTKTDISNCSDVPHLEILDGDKKTQIMNKGDTSKYSEQVQKIIKRVEDIYYQLDEIQESESIDKIPVFKEADVSDVQSEIFLTPFMQAVKDTRDIKQSNKMALIEKSPSYYNVMSFLDALTNIQKEMPYEVHTAQLQHYVHVTGQATVCHQSEIWHEAHYSSSTSLKTSCLKRINEETRCNKHKKVVSFSKISKENKSSQVTLCPFHKVKVLRISSQQFPPLESSDEEAYETRPSKVNRVTEAIKCTPLKIHRDSATECQRKLCKIHGEARKTPGMLNTEICKRRKSEVGPGEAKKCKVSVIDDKSTQVFCQMQAEAKQEENSSAAEENTYVTSNDEQSVDCPEYLEENPDDSKSTDKDFLDDSLMDPFYDYTNDTITPKVVMQKIEGIYEEDNVKHVNSVQTQPKIVVFREVLENPIQPVQNINNLNDIELYKKRLEKRKEIRLMRKSSTELVKRKILQPQRDNENVVLLKSFYAIVYILMFTALSLDYRCL